MGLNTRDRLFGFASLVLPLAYLVPNHYPPWASFHADWVTGIALIPLMFWATWQRGPLPALALGVSILSLVPLMQIASGQITFAGDGWMAWLYLIGFSFAVLAGARFVRPRADTSDSIVRLVPMWGSLVLAALISVGIAIHQWLDLQFLGLFILELKPGDRPYANLSQPNQLATLLMLGLAGTAFLFESRVLRESIAMVSALLLAFGVGMTQSRTPLVALALTWTAYLLMRRRAALRTTPAALLLVTAAFALTVWAWPALNNLLLLPGAPSLAERMGQNLRLTLWQSLAAALARSPWVGYGWNQIPLAQQTTALEFPPTRFYFDSSHNLIFDVALWSGLPIALAVAGGLFLWFVRRATACRDPLSWWLLLAIALVFCHAMVEYPLSYAYFLLPVGFFMGALNSVADVGSLRWSPLTLPRPILGVVGLAALAMFVRVSTEYIRLEEELREIRFEQSRIGDARAGTAPRILVLTQLQARARFAQTTATRGMATAQLEGMRRVTERYAAGGTTFKYAEALALNDEPQAASVVLAILCKIQQPKLCLRAIDEWRSDSEKKYPELRNVALPAIEGH